MRPASASLALLTMLAWPAAAHRLDEYLQAALISLSRDHVQVQLSLTPGVAVFPALLAAIDRDRDGAISEAEKRAYAAQVLRDLALSVDGRPVQLKLLSSRFPQLQEMREGQGVIRLEMEAEVKSAWNPVRRLKFENHHQGPISVYLMNSLVPEDPALRITAQSRNFRQSVYQVEYIQGGTDPGWIAGGMLFLLTAAVSLTYLTRRWRTRERGSALRVTN